MKKIFGVIFLILFIIVGSVVYFASKSENIIRNAVLEYGPKATGSEVTLDKVRVSLWGGSAGLSDLTIGNPKGFKSPHAFKLGKVDVQLDINSMTNDVIRVKEIRIEGADLIYEIGSNGNNINKLQQNMEAYAQSLGLKPSETDSEVKFIVDNIYLNGTKVKIASDLLGSKSKGLTLPDIHLKNIGSEDKAATAGEVGTAILKAVNQNLSKIITKDMLNNTLEDVKKKLGDIFK